MLLVRIHNNFNLPTAVESFVDSAIITSPRMEPSIKPICRRAEPSPSDTVYGASINPMVASIYNGRSIQAHNHSTFEVKIIDTIVNNSNSCCIWLEHYS
jgi:hypothetical protein